MIFDNLIEILINLLVKMCHLVTMDVCYASQISFLSIFLFSQSLTGLGLSAAPFAQSIYGYRRLKKISQMSPTTHIFKISQDKIVFCGT